MRIPGDKKLGRWSAELVQACQNSQKERLQRGAAQRSLFLSGSDNQDPSTFPYTYAFIDALSSFLYSPVELRFILDSYGASNPLERAKMRAAGAEFHKYFRRSELDTEIESAVTWGLVKGKTFIQLSWTSAGLEGYLVQPEMFGVLEENLNTLDEQEAFCHTTYITPDRFWNIIRNHPEREELFRKAIKYSMGPGPDAPGNDNYLRQVVVGGLQPYQIAGQNPNTSRGNVRWLEAPYPQLSPEIATSLIPFTQLWIKDDDRRFGDNQENREYTTIQFVGEDVVVSGALTHRNLFADQFDPANKQKNGTPSEENPLTGHHPYIEICPNPLDGYFWGRSELFNVALLQASINARVNGINQMLRRQEDPPKFFSGVNGIKQAAYSMMKKAGGYFTDSNPNAKVQDMYPQLPEHIFESLHEFETMYDKMAGFTATMSGKGESGVRAQGHAETLVRTGSPRFKDRALGVERQVDKLGAKVLDMLKAHCALPIQAWIPKQEAGVEGEIPPANPLELPPIPNLQPVDFLFYDLGDNCKVSVDAHSASPAFAQENKSLLFDLFKVGAIDAEQLLVHLHPPGTDSMQEALQRKRYEAAAFAAAHPEQAAELEKKKKK